MYKRSLLTKVHSLVIYSTKVELPTLIIKVDTTILSVSFSVTEKYTSRIWKPYNNHDSRVEQTYLYKESHFYNKTCHYPNYKSQNSISYGRRTNININLQE